MIPLSGKIAKLSSRPTCWDVDVSSHAQHPLVVMYQIRSLNNDELLFQTKIAVPKDEVKINVSTEIHVAEEGPMADVLSSLELEQDNFSPSEPPLLAEHEFVLAATISATLMEVVVGSTLIKIALSNEASGPHLKSTTHVLQFLRDNSGFRRNNTMLWKLSLSPGAEYLLLLRRSWSIDAIEGASGRLDVDVFQDLNCRRSPTRPKFVWVTWKNLAVSLLFDFMVLLIMEC